MIEIQTCTDKETWDEYVLDNEGHPLQLWSWGHVKEDHGWTVRRLFGFDGTTPVVAAQVLIRHLPTPFRSFAYIPRGPIGDPSHYATFLTEVALRMKRDYKAIALSVEPDSTSFDKPDNWVHATNKILPAETILLSLSNSESELLTAMAKKTRQYIRKSASDVTIRKARTKEDIQACLAIYAETSVRAGFNLHDTQYYEDVFLHMQDHSPVFMAYEGDTPVAFLWLAVSAYTAYELYGGVTNRGQELRANYALKWYAIRKAKEWGLERYDFGGLVQGGVSTFKQQWSNEITVLAGTYDKPLSPLYTLWSHTLPFAKKTVQRFRKPKSLKKA